MHYFDEFTLGIDSEPGIAIRDIKDFKAEWLREGNAVAIMHDSTYEDLHQQGLPMQIIHQDPRRIAVRKP